MAIVGEQELKRIFAAAGQQVDAAGACSRCYQHENEWWSIDWNYYSSNTAECKRFWAYVNNHATRFRNMAVEIGGFPVTVRDGRREWQGAFRYHSIANPEDTLPEGDYWSMG
ncbi:hypothetical protein COV06_00470 [Candidatus Uhrbacteria bacterium CG10_big_fil_rev_8_21_14_0_10_50_16]|uniref:Uncharacterized protein n=1 Tax=Candidatus Uhrbacteria bacterium CG10_big_fil_rev_8_21_14_0_10_50_16 TaxID=1975039 RepID=A0A2H0RMT9_9BACT|nr:MAG: hypothetical protein COV06_00470 [Candidatus Uhrbacteria bacterium CG10_big_fil_rev_8_21_14_0_10_50_16]